jgi:flagellar basal body rod protein FlgG
MDNSIFVDIKDFEGYFQINKLGIVKSLCRKIIQTNGHPITIKEKILKIQIDKDGYQYVHLCKGNFRKNIKVHSLVAKTFIENPENKNTINHKDGNRANNNVENLEWNTSAENVKHGFKSNKRIHPNTGKVGVWKGKHFSDDHKEKIRISNIITKNKNK